MPQDTKIILYKNFQIEIKPESLPDDKWEAHWWIWISDEAVHFFDNENKFDTKSDADSRAEIQAKTYIDKIN